MEKELSRCEKLEDKSLRVLFGGYYKKEEQIRAQWSQVMRDYSRLSIEHEVFKVLEGQESRSLITRLQEAQHAVAMQEQKENELQIRYANLKAEKERVDKELANLKSTPQ